MRDSSSQLLNPGEMVRLRIASRRSAPDRPGHPQNTLFWTSCLAVLLTLPACTFMIAMTSYHSLALENVSLSVFVLLVIAYFISYAGWRFSHDKMTLLFTNERLIVTNSAPNVPPKSIANDEITQIAVHVNNDGPYLDTRREEARFSEYFDYFNQPDWHAMRGTVRQSIYHRPPNNGIIRLYGPDALHAVIVCPGSLRQRVKAIRRILGLNVVIQ